MRITIRLYKRYDIDLLSLYHNSEFKFKESFKSAVRNYIRGTPQKIKIPEPQDDTFSYETIQFQLNFHPKEDQDVIMWIRNIKAGYKNSILKNMFRNSLCGIYYYYTMNVHRADEMLTLNQKSAEAATNDDKKDQNIIVDDKRDNKIKEVHKEEQEKRDVNDKLDDETKNSEDDHSEEIKEEYKDKTSNSDIKSKVTIPISNTEDQKIKENEPEEVDEVQKEPEFTESLDNEKSNETVDIDDSYDEDENDSIFAIAGKMMQGFLTERVNHVITEFNKTKEYNKNLKEKVEEIKRICNNLDIPCFLTFCVKNNEMETVYQTEYLSPGQKQQYLKNNRFADYVNIINGFTTTPYKEEDIFNSFPTMEL